MNEKSIKEFFLKYIHENKRQPLDKIKAVDLTILYIYKDNINKPFIINKRNKVDYFNTFHAIDKKGNSLYSVKALDKNEGREQLRKSINKQTKRYKEWEESGFTIKYSDGFIEIQKYLIENITNDFPHISNPFNYYARVCDEFEKLLPNKKRRR